MSLINIELPNGKTVKVNSDWYYNMSDAELDKFFDLQEINFEYHTQINNPFDNSAMEAHQLYDSDIEDEDIELDYNPDEWD